MKLISTWRKLTSFDEHHLHMVELLVKKILLFSLLDHLNQ